MRRVFVDANIVIDLLCERHPWFPQVLRIFSMGDLKQIDLYCSSLSLGTADALQHCSAQTVDADCIVTRNKKDFSASEIPVYDIDEFLDLMQFENNK